jgi:hypothetical protein
LAQITARVAAFEEAFFEPLTHDELIKLGELLARLYATTPEAQGKGMPTSTVVS